MSDFNLSRDILPVLSRSKLKSSTDFLCAVPIVEIRPLVDGLNRRFNQLRQPPREQSIEESMVKFKRRSKMRHTMKSKPIKSGFKLWNHCDDLGYVLVRNLSRK